MPNFLCAIRVRCVCGRQVQRERASRARYALQPDFAAQKRRDFTADRQTEAGSAVLAAGGAVGLLECLEYDSVLLGRDSDSSIANSECDDTVRLNEDRMIRSPAFGGDAHFDRHTAALSELERIRQQILQYLLQPALIGVNALRDRDVLRNVER